MPVNRQQGADGVLLPGQVVEVRILAETIGRYIDARVRVDEQNAIMKGSRGAMAATLQGRFIGGTGVGDCTKDQRDQTGYSEHGRKP